MDQEKYQGGVCHEGKGRRGGGGDKGGKDQEDEEIGGGLRKFCGREEQIFSNI